MIAAQERLVEHAPVGARILPGGVEYRVWAPDVSTVHLLTDRGRSLELKPEQGGYFSAIDARGSVGDRYHFRLPNDIAPDPASRYQPCGVEGPSEVVDPDSFPWTTDWVRPPIRGRVVYEMHVGAFTPAGTFIAAIEKLDYLVGLGVNTIELMPLGDFAGRWNWGYDGVMIFAPARCYGRPDDLRRLIDAAHRRGLAVVIDVVYNHVGPCGNPLRRFTQNYFQHERPSLWGPRLDFDGPCNGPVRAFFFAECEHVV